MRCLVCNGTEWENVDQYRIKPEGMSICKSCGFVSYPTLWKSEEDLKEYYRKDYRRPPNAGNLYTGMRKLNYHHAFLKDLFKQFKDENRKDLEFGEVGAAYGMFLNYIKGLFPEATVGGTELTVSYRRNAFHEYGIELSEDFDLSKKYDLIASYKVAEHMFDVDKHIRQLVEALKPNGYLYISVPTWFGRMNNFGKSGFDIEYYYSTNHINVWTKKLFEQVLKKCGAKIIKHDGVLYDDTYLCVRDDSLMNEQLEFENIDDIKNKMERIKKASDLFNEGLYQQAIDAYPDFPEAHAGRYEKARSELHKLGYDKIKETIIDDGLKKCNDDPSIYAMAGDISMRYEKYTSAIEWFEKYLSVRPGFSPAIRGISHCLRYMGKASLTKGNHSEGLIYYAKARNVMRYLKEISPQDEQEAIGWIYDDNAKIPMPSELKQKEK